jgi:hypothetical protein
MNREAVQHERGPRTATLRKQMDMMMFTDKTIPHASPPPGHQGLLLPVSVSSPLLSALYSQHAVLPPLFSASSSDSTSISPTPNLSSLPPSSSPYFCSSIYEAAARILFLNSKWAAGLPPISALSPMEQVALLSPSWRDLFVMGCGQLLAASPTTLAEKKANVCEAAARILFLNSKWAQHLPSFSSLPPHTQVDLMASSWKELFILGCGQFITTEDVACLGPENDEENEEATEFLNALSRIQALGPDSMEFACLRAIQLFRRPSSDDPSKDPVPAAIAELQRGTLGRYSRLARPDQADRADQLLRMLDSLSLVAATTVRDLFFRATIGGHVDIHQIVIDMFKNSSKM